MAGDQPVVKIVQHFEGELVICPPGCIAIDPELEIPELDIPEALMREPDESLVVVQDEPERTDRPLVIAVVGTRVDLRPMADRIEQAEQRGEPVEVHVFKEARAVPQAEAPAPAR